MTKSLGVFSFIGKLERERGKFEGSDTNCHNMHSIGLFLPKFCERVCGSEICKQGGS